MIMLGYTEAWTESVLSQLPKEAAIRFAHADLVPKNIIVEGSTITGIVDWALSGFFPDFWEYGRMHDPMEMTRRRDCAPKGVPRSSTGGGGQLCLGNLFTVL